MDEAKWPIGFVPEPDLQGLEPLAYDTDKPNGGSNHFKPYRPSNRQMVRRDDSKDNSRGFLGSQPRFYTQSQTRQQGPNPGYRRNARLEY